MNWRSRGHFFGVASKLMRRVLVDYARKNQAAKRDPGAQIGLDLPLTSLSSREEVLAVDQALRKLESNDARKALVVERKYFGGMTTEETADSLEISVGSVERDWNMRRPGFSGTQGPAGAVLPHAMKSDAWSRGDQVFHDAFAPAGAGSRGAGTPGLRRDSELCREVLSLLECHREAGAVNHYRQALAIYEGLTPGDDPVTRRYLGIIHERRGKMFEVEGRRSEALVSYQKSFAIRKALAADYPLTQMPAPTRRSRTKKSAICWSPADRLSKGSKEAHAAAKEAARARVFYAKARTLFQRLASADPMNARARADLGRVSSLL